MTDMSTRPGVIEDATRWAWMVSDRRNLVSALSVLDQAAYEHWSRARINAAIDRMRDVEPQPRRPLWARLLGRMR